MCVPAWAKQTGMEDVDLQMCSWLMNNLVSKDVSLHFTAWLHVCVWIWQKQRVYVRVCLCARVHVGGLAFWPRRRCLAAVLIDVKPLHLVAFCQNMKAAGSTNPGALNSAICPAMCSHPAAESSARPPAPRAADSATGTVSLLRASGASMSLGWWDVAGLSVSKPI